MPACGANGWKQLACPKCKQLCGVKGGRAAELPTNYDIMGHAINDKFTGLAQILGQL